MKRLRVLTLGLISVWSFVAGTAIAGEGMQIRHRFRHLTIEHGLSQSSVNCMLQDRHGFVWLGTQDGLNRHDGYRFLIWKTDADDPLSFSDAYITALAEDHQGHLWVGSEASGFARFNRIEQRFDFMRTGPERDADASGTNYGVLALAIDHLGQVWIGTNAHGLLSHDPRTGTQRSWTTARGQLPSDEVTALAIDRRGRLWIGTAAGLVRLDQHQDELRVWSPLAGPSQRVEAIHHTATGEIYVGTGSGLLQWDPAAEDFHLLDAVTVGVHAIAEDSDGNLWLGCLGHGVIRLDPASGESLQLLPDLRTATNLQTAKMQTIMVDAADVVWVGHDLGASLLDTHAKQFYHFKHEVGRPGTISNNTVWSFCEDRDGLVWIATDQGLNRFDPRTGRSELLAADPLDPRRPSHDRMTAVHQDSRGSIWLGYAHGALNVLDPATGVFRRVQADSTGRRGAPSVRVYAFAEASDGVMWMATFDGLQSWDPDTGRFTAHWREPGGPFDLGGHACKTLQIDPAGVIWVGSWGAGVVAIDPETGGRHEYRHAPGDHQTITSDTILSLLLDSRGQVWVGTGSGLTRLDPRSGHGVRLTEKDGLPNNTIYALAEDPGGRIWAGTNYGLIRLDRESLDLRHFQAKDGLQSNEFNMGAAYLGRSGLLYFGGINGFNVFDPARILVNPYVPPVLLTEFQINNERIGVGQLSRGRRLLSAPIYQTTGLELDRHDHVVSFGFTALHYAAPEKNRYAYRLEGFDTAWTEVGGRAKATYTNLPPGSYVLRVRGTNSDGVWNEEGVSLQLQVHPPFYQTAWFLILVALTGLSAVNGIIRYRTRLMKVRTQDLEKMVARRTADLTRANHFLQQEISERRRMEDALRVAKDQAEEATRTKSEFLANMSHEIRTPMNGVLGMTSVLLEGNPSSEQREHLEVVHASARNLLSIINDILDFSKIEASKLELECIDFDLRDLVEEVAEMLGPRAHAKGLDFALRIDHDVPAALRGDPLRIRQVLVNLISNAVKFTERGQVTVSVSMPDRNETDVRLRFEISDTGVGIPTDRMDRLFESFSQVDTSTTRHYGGTGLGLAICKQLVDLMDGELLVESELQVGTTFSYLLTLPSGQAADALEVLGGAVLVITPDPRAREAAAECLRYLGCEPLTAPGEDDPAHEAVVAVGRRPDIRAVLTGGWTEAPSTRGVPRKLEAALGAAAPPCLALFNLGEAVDGDQMRQAGFRGWVSRPLRSRRLREALQNLVAEPRPVATPGVVEKPAPVAAPAATAAGTRPTGAGVDDAPAGLPLLLAEDNPVNQKVASILLRKLGYQVDVVDNGEQAVGALASRRYAMVFMDVQMPVMDGYEAVRRIRAGQDDVLEPTVLIIALTAHAMKGDRQRCLDAGMNDYLPKPIDQKALAALLERYLGAPQTVEV